MTKRKARSKLKIGIDIDNVIADTHHQYLNQFNLTFGTDVLYEDCSFFYFEDLSTEIKAAQITLFIEKLLVNDEFQSRIPPYSEAVKTVKKWIKKGFFLHYISARPKEAVKITKTWLIKHGFWVEGRATLDLVDFRHGKDTEFKKDIASKLGIDLMIEDSREIANAFSAPVLLLSRPWNRGELKGHVTRVKDWREIELIVAKYEK